MNRMNLSLTGITREHGACACCNRTLTRVYELSDGNTYGRACAAKLTGFSITDRALRMAQKAAQVKAERLAAGWGVSEFAAFARSSEGCVSDVMVYADGQPHVIDWAEAQVSDLYA